MPCILNIETATEACSVVVSNGSKVIFEKEEKNGPSHASLLGVFVDEAMKEIRSRNIRLDAVAVSCGPGSYTGLRIGVSEAKGLCYGLKTPLIAIETLKIMAHGVITFNQISEKTLICPMIDARRMEVYDAIYDKHLNIVRDTSADIIDENSFLDLLSENKLILLGNGANKCKDIIKHENAIFADNIYPKASDMIWLAEKAYSEDNFVDSAYFEPFYLKEFIATKAKNKVI